MLWGLDMMPPCCGTCCLRYSTRFEWDAGELDGAHLGPDSDWTFLPNLSTSPDYAWIIQDIIVGGVHTTNFLAVYGSAGHEPYRALWEGTPPRHFSCTARVCLFTSDDSRKFRIRYGTDDGDTIKRYAVEIEFLDAGPGSEGTDCGIMRLLDISDDLSPLQIGLPVPVGPLVRVRWFDLTLCYDPETQVLRAKIEGGRTLLDEEDASPQIINGSQWIHWKNVETHPDPADSALELEFPDLEDGETGFVRSFRVYQSKNIDDEITGDYGEFGDGESEACKCCRPDGCEVDGDEFDDDDLSCRWTLLSGAGFTEQDSEAGGNIVGAGTLAWRGSWSGVTSDCLPDCSVRVKLVGQTPSSGGSATYSIHLDAINTGTYHKVQFQYLSGNGTLKLFRVESGSATELESMDLVALSADRTWSLTACMIRTHLIADLVVDMTSFHLASGESDYGGMTTTPFCGPFVRIAGGGDSDVVFYSFEVSHNLESGECPTCVATPIDDCCCCEPGTSPETIYMQIATDNGCFGEIELAKSQDNCGELFGKLLYGPADPEAGSIICDDCEINIFGVTCGSVFDGDPPEEAPCAHRLSGRVICDAVGEDFSQDFGVDFDNLTVLSCTPLHMIGTFVFVQNGTSVHATAEITE